MFDGRNYTDPTPVRKSLYHPQNALSGAVEAQNLRNAYCVARNDCRGMIAQCWERNHLIPTSNYFDSNEITVIANYVTLAQDWRRVAAHMTHAFCHICFSIMDTLGEHARFRFGALQAGAMVNELITTIDLAPGGGAPATQFDPFDAPGGNYETILPLPLVAVAAGPGITAQPGLGGLPAFVRFQLRGYAFYLDGAGHPQSTPMRIDSVSMWLESRI